MGGYVGKWLIRKRNFFANSILKRSFGIKSRLTPEIHKHYLQPLEKENERIGSWIFPGQITGSTLWLRALWEKRDILKDKDTLIAWGLKDIAFREKELNVWIRSFPNAHFIRYDDAGHFVAEEKGDDLAVRIENFLMSGHSQTRLF